MSECVLIQALVEASRRVAPKVYSELPDESSRYSECCWDVRGAWWDSN